MEPGVCRWLSATEQIKPKYGLKETLIWAMLYSDSIDAPPTPTRPVECEIQGSLRTTRA